MGNSETRNSLLEQALRNIARMSQLELDELKGDLHLSRWDSQELSIIKSAITSQEMAILNYQNRIEAKRDRFLDCAGNAEKRADQARRRSDSYTDGIPMGQPILVGHHSEGRHRRALARSHDAMHKSIEERDKSDYYQQKAVSVGTGGIASDDPEALSKLKTKLEKLENQRDSMKRINAAFRKYQKNPDCLHKLKLSESEIVIVKAFKPQYSWETAPYSGWPLQNLGANIRQVKSRIEELGHVFDNEERYEEHSDFVYKEEDGRCQFVFEGKPDEEVRRLLKSYGFKWSPTRGAWVRKLTQNALNIRDSLIEKIKACF